MKHNVAVSILIAALLFFLAVPSDYGQVPQQQANQAEAQQGLQTNDPVRQLNLTPEQREKIRSIREQNKAERAAMNQRTREAYRALEEVLDVDNPDETLVEQRLRDVATAQAASMRMRILTEVRIRRVLTPEQLTTLRTLREQARQSGNQRFRTESEQQRRQVESQQNQRNGLGPLFPRRQLQRRPRP
jgi:Spy/CpxP family protein refolding chaperone